MTRYVLPSIHVKRRDIEQSLKVISTIYQISIANMPKYTLNQLNIIISMNRYNHSGILNIKSALLINYQHC